MYSDCLLLSKKRRESYWSKCAIVKTNRKKTQSLPPDGKSILQAIKCILYLVYDWSRVDEAIISDILLQNSGWIVNNDNE